ncbi:MAG: thioredoxin fold domain-containing protein [Candidatus Algichlamydia australiensis]|nr:thioredoxin fold domain-containing protein [Chlamydiales bacterium]
MSLSGLSHRRLIASLFALFAALSLVGKELAICQGCVNGVQYITYVGIVYFLGLSLTLYFWRTFPTKPITYVGFFFSCFAAFFLTVSKLEYCVFCVTAHILHIAVWSLLLTTCYFRSLAIFFSAILVISVPTLHIKEKRSKVVGRAPNFSFTTKDGKIIQDGPPPPYSALVLHFVQEGCPYCEEQIEEIENLVDYYPNYLFYHVSSSELKKGDRVELIVSKETAQIFHINLFPTLVVIDKNGDVIKIVRGRMPENSTLTQFIGKIFPDN